VAARAGLDISPGAVWALVRIDEHGVARARALAEQTKIPPERVAEVIAELRDGGLVAGEDGDGGLTAAGHDLAARVVAARRDQLHDELADASADRDPEVELLLRRLARELSGERP
jgi:DNA-binding MarR family transcriptional regulator